MRNAMIATLAAAIVASACSTHPLPEDFARDHTVQIVHRVRCEARTAVRDRAIQFFLRDDAPGKTKRIGIDFQQMARSFKTFRYEELDADSLKYVTAYDGAAIGYEFTFDITENNNVGGTLDLVRPLTGGALSLGFTAGSELKRQNTRNFVVTDTFEDLLRNLDEAECAETARGKNWIYPMTGSVGLAELIDTYIELNETGRLAGKEKSKVPLLADTLLFQTKLYASLGPTLELQPAGRRWQTSGATGSVAADRVDVHKMIIALSLPPEPSKVVSAPRAPGQPIKAKRSGSEEKVIKEIERQKQNQFLNSSTDIQRRLGLTPF